MDPKETRFLTEMLKKIDKGGKIALMTCEDYHATLSSLQEAIETNAAKTSHQRHLMNLYEILICGQETKLIMKRKDENEQPKHFLFVEELKRVHVLTGHGGRDRF